MDIKHTAIRSTLSALCGGALALSISLPALADSSQFISKTGAAQLHRLSQTRTTAESSQAPRIVSHKTSVAQQQLRAPEGEPQQAQPKVGGSASQFVSKTLIAP